MVNNRDRKTIRRLVLISVPVIVVIISSLILLPILFSQEPRSEVIGRSIIQDVDLKIQLLNESEVFLSEFQGRPIILDFFATWCTPCERQMPILQSLTIEYQNLQVISIAVDPLDTVDRLQLYSQENNMSWVIGRDAELKAGSRFKATVIPTLVFVDAQGIIRQITHQETSHEELVSWIESRIFLF
ncbi:MAG: TlpA family protein disulfide reductase [Candidatus Hodarchaeota archaeon]